MAPVSLKASEAASHRRQIRLRREYLFRKSLDGKERDSYEQKRIIREALAAGKAIPTELRASYDKLHREIQLEDAKTSTAHSHVDDEYGDAGLFDPRVCVTTSRDPSSRLKQFAKEIKLVIPNSTRINRGNNRVDELVSSCKQGGFSDLVVLQETRGEPDGLVVCHLPLGPTAFFSITGAVLRHDLEGGKAAPMSEAYPHLILNDFHTPLGRRISNVLKCLFPVPKPDTKRVLTFHNDNDFISFRNHMYSRVAGTDNVTLHEVGPRFQLRLYQLRLGTLDQKDAENEYILRNFQNTSNKNKVL